MLSTSRSGGMSASDTETGCGVFTPIPLGVAVLQWVQDTAFSSQFLIHLLKIPRRKESNVSNFVE
jgi:hypothetical protein